MTFFTVSSKRRVVHFALALHSVWMLGVILIVVMKGVHLLIFLVARHAQRSNAEKQLRSVKHRLWLHLCSNAFTSGLILGTIVYHLIPHV